MQSFSPSGPLGTSRREEFRARWRNLDGPIGVRLPLLTIFLITDSVRILAAAADDNVALDGRVVVVKDITTPALPPKRLEGTDLRRLLSSGKRNNYKAVEGNLRGQLVNLRRNFRRTNATKSGKRHHLSARLSWQQACNLGFRGDLEEWIDCQARGATAPPSAVRSFPSPPS